MHFVIHSFQTTIIKWDTSHVESNSIIFSYPSIYKYDTTGSLVVTNGVIRTRVIHQPRFTTLWRCAIGYKMQTDNSYNMNGLKVNLAIDFCNIKICETSIVQYVFHFLV